jgi:hypothetical protein
MKLPDKLIIKQQIEPIELLTNFETKNKYRIMDENEKVLMYAYEDTHWLSRQILRQNRPIKIDIVDLKGKNVCTLERKWFLFKSKTTVHGEANGEIEQKSWAVKRVFDVYDSKGLAFTASSRLHKIWTYNLLKDGKEVGTILKKWKGVVQELYTDADQFDIDYKGTTEQKLLAIATALTIDLRFFEHHK